VAADLIEAERLDEVTLKGIALPVPTYRVASLSG
jgi:class 3 adenylate cyclase